MAQSWLGPLRDRCVQTRRVLTLIYRRTQVSSELIRVSILWHEMWHEALEEASRLYFGEQNVEGMLGVLLPLHEKIEQEQAVTLKEISFVQVRGPCGDEPSCRAAATLATKCFVGVAKQSLNQLRPCNSFCFPATSPL